MTEIDKHTDVKMPKHILDYVLSDQLDTEAPLFIDPRGHLVRKYTRGEIADYVSLYARGIAATEFRKGRNIAIIARTSFASFIASLGNMLNGCANIIIPIDATPEEQQHMLIQGRAEALIVEDIKTAKAVLSRIQYLPQLRQMIVLNNQDFEKQAEVLCMSWDELIERGEKKPDKREELLSAIEMDDEVSTFFVKDNKDEYSPLCMTHRDISGYLHKITEAFEKRAVADVKKKDNNKTLSVIPFHRPFSHIAGIFLPLSQGFPFMAVDHTDAWKSGNFPMRPQLVIGESSFLEEVVAAVEKAVQQGSSLGQKMWKMSKTWGRTFYKSDGQIHAGLSGKFQRFLFQAFLQRKLAQQLGGKVRLIMSIDKDISYNAGAFYASVNMPLLFNQLKPQDLLVSEEIHTNDGEKADQKAA